MPRVSLRPGDTVAAGLIDDQDVEVVDARFTTVPPKNYPVSDRTFAVLKLKVLPSGPEAEQYWSVGSNQQYVPDVNNPRILNSSRSGLPDSCQFALFLSRLVEAGFPESRIGDDLGFLIGTRIHVERVDAPERKGLPAEGRTVLVPTRLISLPAEKSEPLTGVSGESQGAYSEQVYCDLATHLANRIIESGPIAKTQVITIAMKLAGSDSRRMSELLRAANDDAFYGHFGFTLEGGIVNLPPQKG